MLHMLDTDTASYIISCADNIELTLKRYNKFNDKRLYRTNTIYN